MKFSINFIYTSARAEDPSRISTASHMTCLSSFLLIVFFKSRCERFLQGHWQSPDGSAWAVYEAHSASTEWELLQRHIHSIKAWPWHPRRTAKWSQVASTPSASSFLLFSTTTYCSMIVRLYSQCKFCIVGCTEEHICLRSRMLNTNSSVSLLIGSRTIRIHECADVTLHLISIRARELQRACNRPAYIMQDHIHCPFDCPSVVLIIARIHPHLNVILIALWDYALHCQLKAVWHLAIIQMMWSKPLALRPTCTMPIAYTSSVT